MSENIIREVVTRTKGEMYLGVVGPVRSGKSSFIRKFMELKVLPYIQDEETYHKVLDELPQSGEGKSIMTVEPKFIPSNNMVINVDDDLNLNVRLVDCVGYIIPSSKGYLNEDGTSRLVQTPWFSEPIPFGDAAGLGTRKVIESHSNIGILMSSDGSFGEFRREEYAEIEETMVEELKVLNKPFVLVINTIRPNDENTRMLVDSLVEKYDVSVIALDVQNMTSSDVDRLLKEVLNEFDISELNIGVPNWVSVLEDTIPFKQQFNEIVSETTGSFRKMKDVFHIQEVLKACEFFTNVDIVNVDAGNGIVDFDIRFDDAVYMKIVEEIMGEPLEDKGEFLRVLQTLKKAKTVYDKVGNMEKVYQVGYDVVVPNVSEMKLETPELSKQGGRYGIKIKATASTLLITRVDVESTFEPIIGSMEQSQVLVDHMVEDFENNSDKLWNSEIFGRKLCDVINDGIKVKVNNVPDKVLEKYRDGIEKVVNHSKGGVLAIVL